jgi:hypothetical protein
MLSGGELGVLLLEAFDAAGGIDELLFARVERVANAADFHFDMLERAARLKRVAARTAYLGKVVLGVNLFFHDILFFSKGKFITPCAVVPLCRGEKGTLLT